MTYVVTKPITPCTVCFHSMDAIGVVEEHFDFRSPKNTLAGDQRVDSQFEGITHRTDKETFIVVREAEPAGGDSGGRVG